MRRSFTIDNTNHTDNKGDSAPRSSRSRKFLSRVATLMCISMYISYVPQILANFAGEPVSPLQPLVACINATLWVAYGWTKPHKDWPVIVSNFPGILFGIITVITVYIH